MAWYHNKKVKAKAFMMGNLVLRRAEISRPTDQGKLSPNWEGLYKVTEVIRPNTYRLETLEGHQLTRPGNVQNLRAYYQ